MEHRRTKTENEESPNHSALRPIKEGHFNPTKKMNFQSQRYKSEANEGENTFLIPSITKNSMGLTKRVNRP